MENLCTYRGFPFSDLIFLNGIIGYRIDLNSNGIYAVER
jgi:hypothetical protein